MAGKYLSGKGNNIPSVPSRPVSQSIFHILEQVREQVEYSYFADRRSGMEVDPLIGEMCLIIAEVLVMDPDGVLKVGGSEMGVRVVQEIYRYLGHYHLELVYNNFHGVTSRVYNKKAYLRTALYNAVFELESHYTNLVRHDMST